MDGLDIIRKLAEKARNEPIPHFDVSGSVLRRLESEDEAFSFVLFDVLAGVSALAALVMALLSAAAWQYMANPIAEYLAPLQEVPLW